MSQQHNIVRGGGKLGIEKCEKSAMRPNNFGNDLHVHNTVC